MFYILLLVVDESIICRSPLLATDHKKHSQPSPLGATDKDNFCASVEGSMARFGLCHCDEGTSHGETNLVVTPCPMSGIPRETYHTIFYHSLDCICSSLAGRSHISVFFNKTPLLFVGIVFFGLLFLCFCVLFE